MRVQRNVINLGADHIGSGFLGSSTSILKAGRPGEVAYGVGKSKSLNCIFERLLGRSLGQPLAVCWSVDEVVRCSE